MLSAPRSPLFLMAQESRTEVESPSLKRYSVAQDDSGTMNVLVTVADAPNTDGLSWCWPRGIVADGCHASDGIGHFLDFN